MPDFVMILVVDPRLLPNSAVALWVRILNSVTASTGGLRTKPPSTPLKLLAPSIKKLFDSGRCPLTAYDWPWRIDDPASLRPGVNGTTPGCKVPSCVKFRPLRGRSSISRSCTTLPNAVTVDWISCASAVT